MDIYAIVYILGFSIATVIRSFYGMQFKRKDIVKSRKENPVVYFGMALWGVALIAPFVTMFSDALAMADYEIIGFLRVVGGIVFLSSLWVLWRSHVDLADNFTPALFIRGQHRLVTTGIYRKIRHPMYLSFYMWAIGQALLIQNWIAGPLGLFAFGLIYLFRIDREEQQLLAQFGADYENYMKSTYRLFPK